MERNEAVERIKKLMAIAGNPSATENEVQTAIVMADKLRIKFKIQDQEIDPQEIKDVERIMIAEQTYGYYGVVLPVLAEHFRCETTRIGRIDSRNVSIFAYGLKEDIEFFVIVAKKMIEYFDRIIFCKQTPYKSKKQKFSYLNGFASGLESALEKSVKELCLEKRYEIAVIGVPAVVKEFRSKMANSKKLKGWDLDYDAYTKGFEDGLRYQV